MLTPNLDCPFCGRDYRGDDELKPGDECPATDDCPSHFEEKGEPCPE